MEKSLFTRVFKKLPLAFLFAVVLLFGSQLALINSAFFWDICYFYSVPARDDALFLEAQIRRISKSNSQKIIFLVGSSQTREAFDMADINNAFKENKTIFYNLGISGGQPIDLFMIKNKLLNKNPYMIIYMSSINDFYVKYGFNKMKYYFSPNVIPYLFKYVNIETISNHIGDLGNSFFGESLLLYKYKNSLTKIFCKALMDRTGIVNDNPISRIAYYEDMTRPYFLEEIKKADGERFGINETTRLNMVLFELCARDFVSRGIKFLVFDAPNHPLLKETYKRELDEQYRSLILNMAEKDGFIYLNSELLPSFMENDFVDFNHLNAKGRKKLTKFLEGYIKGIDK